MGQNRSCYKGCPFFRGSFLDVHCHQSWPSHTYIIILPNGHIIVEPLNKGHYGAKDFVPCREVVPISEVKQSV